MELMSSDQVESEERAVDERIRSLLEKYRQKLLEQGVVPQNVSVDQALEKTSAEEKLAYALFQINHLLKGSGVLDLNILRYILNWLAFGGFSECRTRRTMLRDLSRALGQE